MKIDNSLFGISVTSSDNQPNSAESGQVSFADQLTQVLQQALLETTGKNKQEDELISKLQQALPQDAINAFNNNTPASISGYMDGTVPARDSVNGLDELLGMLEEYESLLADPTTSLKYLAPLVNRMQEKATAMEARLDNMDNSINPLANQIISQAQIEAIKFHRGDYV